MSAFKTKVRLRIWRTKEKNWETEKGKEKKESIEKQIKTKDIKIRRKTDMFI